MEVFRFPLTRITFLFIAGILAGFYVKPETATVSIFFLGAAVLMGFLFFFSKKLLLPKAGFGITAWLMAFVIGMLTWAVHSDYRNKNHYLHFIRESGSRHNVVLVIREKLKSSTFSQRYVAHVKRVDGKYCDGKILVNTKDNPNQEFRIGENLIVEGVIVRHQKPKNPGQFDYGSYLDRKSIPCQLYASHSEIRSGNRIAKDIWYYSDQLRTTITRNLERSGLREQELAVAIALILGQQQDISPEVLQDYQYAGAVHILSVSGLHVGFLLLFVSFLLKPLPKNNFGQIMRLSLILIFLWGFAIIAGLAPSVVRSVTMFSFVAIGMHLKRPANIFHTLVVSLFLILLFEPAFLFDVGFQLSYVALFFILWLQPLFSGLWNPDNKILKYIWDLLTVSFAAQIGAFPLSTYYFHQFPGLFFITNLLIIPFLTFIMGLGTFVMVLAVFGKVPILLVQILQHSIALMNGIINWISSFREFIFTDIPFNFPMLLTLYLLIIIFIVWFKKPKAKTAIGSLVAVVLFQLCCLGNQWQCQRQKEWILFHTGKSTLITDRNGKEVIAYNNAELDMSKKLNSYLVAEFCSLKKQQPLKNVYFFKEKKILLIDSSGVYPVTKKTDVLVMIQSPKINLERLISNIKPRLIIADASNYKTYIAHWKATCLKTKIPFHATAEKGFYILK